MPDEGSPAAPGESDVAKIACLFAQQQREGNSLLVPFVTAGDPDLATTAAVLETLASAGCRICEIGFPFSDPVADGPVIQASYQRALASDGRVDAIFGMLPGVVERTGLVAIGMVSCSIVYRRGFGKFASAASRAGLAGLIVPDLPAHEAGEFAAACREQGLALIQLVTPNTPAGRIPSICAAASGFLYWVAVSGVTGERRSLPADLVDRVKALKVQSGMPVCAGFGIGTPDQVRELAGAVDGVIVGSALVRILEGLPPGLRPGDPRLEPVRARVRQFLAALG